MKQFSLFILALVLLQSCTPSEKVQPQVLEENAYFDLKKADFNENVPKLYSKNIEFDDVKYDSARDGAYTDDTLRYKIVNQFLNENKLTIPEKHFGFLYKSPEMDSMAFFNDIYFKKINILTDTAKKPIAYYAEAKLKKKKQQRAFIDSLKSEYGKPIHSFWISSEFNLCVYEWRLKDRTIQVETSYGRSYETDFDSKSMVQNDYFLIDMVIMRNSQRKNIQQAHYFVLPEKVLFYGEYYKPKDLKLDSAVYFNDDFLLYSTDEKILSEEDNLHSITRSEDYEYDDSEDADNSEEIEDAVM
ncbi:hypothetical protein [Fulvivirga ligni]|uniref:hypothetical protein n=1 Tax=Fulvivirga ligni TaxID=2904246 RepID=UPI001F46F876|nr:hypothetical protein [Fulvivirga ligni]UII21020.1 hypothetical protein LVD16_24560 [Fulvivirga ligni]